MHIPVLLEETVDALQVRPGSIVVDATLGQAGHAAKIIEQMEGRGIFIGIDVDQKAVDSFTKKLPISPELKIFGVCDSFHHFADILDRYDIEQIDAIIADLGWRIEQISDPQYGMSFRNEAPLDMRLGGQGILTAAAIVNTYSEQALKTIFYQYGQERYSLQIAKAIVRNRRDRPINTTIQLADLIQHTIGKRINKKGIHPATKVFQALRIVVNNEFVHLESFLPQALQRLTSGGRLAIITFHSLEDRIVKHFFRANAGGCVCPREVPICVCGKKPLITLITKKGISPTPTEIERNPRARSATLRVVQRI